MTTEMEKSNASNPKTTPAVTETEIHPRSAESEPPKPKSCALSPEAEPIVSYDENLLERTRTQWQFGDWQSLANIQAGSLEHHPDRAILALLSAAGNLQIGNMTQARQLITLAQNWGCEKKMISRILIAGVYNSLGRISALSGKQSKTVVHFENAMSIDLLGGDARLLTQVRLGEQLAQLGIFNINIFHRDGAGHHFADLSAQQISKAIIAENQKIKDEIKAEVQASFKANNPNPYVHNRNLTPALNQALREFAHAKMKMEGIKAAYIDYLAAKAVQIERNCVGRLATTVQDAIARQLVAESVPGDHLCVLEIGALYGVSLAILYNHAITRFQKVRVVCLDPFDGYYGKALDAVLNQPVNDLTFIRNMQLANVPQEDYLVLKYYSTDSVAFGFVQKLPINLLIIDGDHGYEGIKSDFENYSPLLKSGSYIIFDDYNAKEWPGVQKFIDEDLAKSSHIEWVGSISRTAVVRKK